MANKTEQATLDEILESFQQDNNDAEPASKVAVRSDPFDEFKDQDVRFDADADESTNESAEDYEDDVEVPEEEPRESLSDYKLRLKTLEEELAALRQSRQQKEEPVPKKELDLLKDLADEQFLTQKELDDVIDDPRLINVALNRAVKRALTHVAEKVGPSLQPSQDSALPRMVSEMVRNQINVLRVVDSFYDRNKDLAPFQKFVDQTASNIAQTAIQEGRKITWDKVYEQAGAEIRQALGTAIKKERKGSPALPGSRTGPRPTRKKGSTTQQDLMAEIL